MRIYILYGFGIVSCIAGMAFLSAEYIKYLSEPWKLVSLLLVIGMFGFLGKYFQEMGW